MPKHVHCAYILHKMTTDVRYLQIASDVNKAVHAIQDITMAFRSQVVIIYMEKRRGDSRDYGKTSSTMVTPRLPSLELYTGQDQRLNCAQLTQHENMNCFAI